MIVRHVGAACFALASFAVASGCKPKVSARATQNGEGVVIVSVVADFDATVTVRDQTCQGSCDFKLAAMDFPVGKNTITVEAKRKGKTSSVEVQLDRKKVEPIVVLSTTESGYVPCKSKEFCVADTKLKVGPDSTMTFVVVGPARTKVTIGDASLTLAVPARYVDHASDTLKIDLHRWTTQVPLEGIEGSDGPSVAIHVVAEADSTVEDDLPIPAGWFRPVVHEALAPIEKGPITLGGEPPPPKKPRSMIILGKGEDDVWFVGAPSKLADLDLVAVRTQLAEHTMLTCGPYSGATGSTTLKIVGVDEDVTLYDRRTGKAKAKHHFYAAYQGCPDSVTSLGASDETQTNRSGVDVKSIVSWAKQVLGA